MTKECRQSAPLLPLRRLSFQCAPGSLEGHERARLLALRDYGVLDTPAEQAFDDIVRIAAQVCATPIALVSLVDEARQWFKARVGLEASETPRNVAFCDHAIREPRLLVVPDARADARFCSNPLVAAEPHIRFYAGAPLINAAGFALGTLCVIDMVPRTLEDSQAQVLEALARQVVAQLELRRLNRSQSELIDQLRRSNERLEVVLRATQEMQARLSLSDRMASLGTLVAGVAHEINNPMAYVIGNLEFASQQLQELAPPGEQPALGELPLALADAREGAERVRRIVRDLKALAHPGNERQELFDLHRVLDSAASMAWNEIRHRARLVKAYGPVPRLYASESRLFQVFLNLLVNAAQAIPEGAAAQNEIRVSTWVDDAGRVVAEIRDTGCGIPEALRARILEPFFTTKPQGVGTGLGLSICQGIVRALGGELQLESEVGRGTAMRVLLPVTQQAVAGEAPRERLPAATPRRGRIMVVDDEALVARLLRRMLEAEHDVIAFTQAREALEWLATGQRCDLILCDLMMPDMTGMEFHAELSRGLPESAEQIIFLTGGAFTERSQAFLDQVTNPHVEKPFDPQALCDLIRERLG